MLVFISVINHNYNFSNNLKVRSLSGTNISGVGS